MIKILVDSGSDITYSEAEQLNLILVSMQITINEEVFYDGVNLDKNTFYDYLVNKKVFPKTSLLSPHTYLTHFEEAKKNNDELIVITLSSGLSGTYQSSLIAYEMVNYDKIYIIDSLSATLGFRLLVDECIRLRNENFDTLSIVSAIEQLKTKTNAYAMVNTLEYLHKGGRLSKTQAVIGEFINVKPILSFTKDGKLDMIAKSIGKQKAFKTILKGVKSNPIDPNYKVYYLYSVNSADTIKLKDMIYQICPHDYYIGEVGPTVGTHTGPGIVGLIYVLK